MPGGNGTGPAGMGPMTGRAAGYCAGYSTPGFANPIGGRGFWGGGRGFGRGIAAVADGVTNTMPQDLPVRRRWSGLWCCCPLRRHGALR